MPRMVVARLLIPVVVSALWGGCALLDFDGHSRDNPYDPENPESATPRLTLACEATEKGIALKISNKTGFTPLDFVVNREGSDNSFFELETQETQASDGNRLKTGVAYTYTIAFSKEGVRSDFFRGCNMTWNGGIPSDASSDDNSSDAAL